MQSIINSILGVFEKTDFKNLINSGAIIIDVRTSAEFNSGHIDKSINIPLDNLESIFKKFNKDHKIIVCCASGIRSGMAKRRLKAKGFSYVYNGRSWVRLLKKVS